MSELALELPVDLSPEEQDQLVADLRGIEEVEDAEVFEARSVDLATISVGVQLATQVASLLGPVVGRILDVVRAHRIKGVVMTFPDGTKIAADEITADELDRMLAHVDK